MVYVVVFGGFANTTLPEVVFKLFDGDQVKVVFAISDETDNGTAGDPTQRALGTAVKVGSGFTVTFTSAVAEQPKTSVTNKLMTSTTGAGGKFVFDKTMLGLETFVGLIPGPVQL
jgi:hypothetical protein